MWRRHTGERSLAEITINIALSQAGYTLGMVTQLGFTFTEEEVEEYGVRGTSVDFFWAEFDLAVFLDGSQVHRNKEEKDERIKAVLEGRGLRVLRIKYDAPMRGIQKVKVLGLITSALDELGYKEYRERIQRSFQASNTV